MECLKPEHFLNPVPGKGLRLGHHDAKYNASQEKFKKLHDLEYQGINEPGHDQASAKKANHSDQGGNL
jgi:hypothetical protein